MKHPLFGLGALTVGASLCLLGCDYGRGTVRHQADGLTTNTGGDDLKSGIPNTGRSPVLPGTLSPRAQEIENGFGR
jgi:hypothetical protein